MLSAWTAAQRNVLQLKFDAFGLIPAIIQDALTGRVLMLGWMNEEALGRTLRTGEVWFWSRSRQTLWHKGDTSGNVLRVREVRADCDADCLLVRAEPAGPTCHTGRESCFWQDVKGDALQPPAASFLDELAEIVQSRRVAAPDESYTARLFAQGRLKIAQKVGEEGLEAALAGVAQDDNRLIEESADLLFHLIVLLNERGVALREVLARLAERHTRATQEQ
ncbi:MAG: bifunctional phosphoribosyl-AMP cyclohydrolase/phosphoribosyl-ATP diphosphatase HisIE [Chloroflexi bacterium]|jgi:phosphoribosyl-ATP pyrophosphohydrolase/phosphoribosyl-AMP cyclohydrolase|uniref:Histidine biosynthesis bifunctional protein HisIE n=1 Tax=Candidatus Thermofonsia Clade 3 bacterium TaxID=2364212 RepID=A0A2M8QB69_9CHLR|nr:bifunctional phosphoribosyl-AMP cyclohydrolase/phosphoribosyl-ATP diphosphatase HisIE [Candidatus Roseilinea sp. NK_OTU-006]PJF47063.1 MAG: bifunctional phosphoribosyl-AMP cyclohydrolase/phosphoribosyl-ATP diphosphatase [Candidatus Thermofonsia Clade 3 bacterium]RMG62573.1 MAG: bifunctional phosphoribosyl-AMP cyclohydrolase/phosphoribosyl-ATP diphosphatase HisIE [Chloroflexota bacterium]